MTHRERALSLAALAFAALFGLACAPREQVRPTPTTPILNAGAARTVTSGATAAGTQSPTPLPVIPNLTIYVVKSGDNPTLIAEGAGVPPAQRDAWIAEMLALNGVSDTSLQVGQELILPPPGLINSASPRATTPGSPGAALPRAPTPTAIVIQIAQPISTPTPGSTVQAGPPPFVPTVPFAGFNSPPATNTPLVSPTPTPKPTIAPGERAWLTSSDENALYYYCDLDSGWTNIPADKLLAFDSEQQLLAIWGRFRTKAPDSVC